MLILSRKIGDAIVIGDNISIVVLNLTDNNKVTLGIKAPKDVDIYRQEIYNPNSKISQSRKKPALSENDVELESENFYNS